MRVWSLGVVVGLCLVGCGPESQTQSLTPVPETEEESSILPEDSVLAEALDTQALEDSGNVKTALCKIPFPESTITPGRKWDPPRHYGVDFAQPRGKAVGSVAAGTVVRVAYSGCLGNYVVVKHSHDGKFSGYSHLSSQSVTVNQRVSKGQKIGAVGTTGTCTTGNHLHLTMSTTADGFMQGNTLDPLRYIHACD